MIRRAQHRRRQQRRLADGDGRVAVNDVVAALNTAFSGCPPGA